ncbi:MAG: FAD-binding oxidoreductase, partial [Pseudomonadales bacterium]|nr:FAD-binding oxidoreductase [Pseudomonadales bacterium]
MNSSESWGRYPKAEQTDRYAFWTHDPLPVEKSSLLPRGLGRSYGDSCLNDGGTLLHTTALDRLIAFDQETGLMCCEAGVSFQAILDFAVPRGWFLPVTPGTRFITVGGAVANDIHGKNHHVAGSFGCHVTRFELLRSAGRRMLCSETENSDFFAATIGGLGLTGLITWVEFQMIPIHNPFIEVENIRFDHISQFAALNAESEAKDVYTVSWIDTSARGSRLGRGIFMRGNHAGPKFNERKRKQRKPLPFPL